MTSELQDYCLPRTGAPSLSFRGELLAEVQGEEFLEPRGRNPRWHDLELYRTAGGRHVLYVRYRTDWPGEVGHDLAMVLESPQNVAEALRSLDPTEHVRGYPEGIQDRERKQRVLLADLRTRFDRCVGDLFAQAGPEFSERVE